MSRVTKSIDVAVPVQTAYNQWTQFETFPQFMDGVQEVTQIDDQHVYWRAKVGGRAKEWEAEIRQQLPDAMIVWTSTQGATNAGLVRFDDMGPGRSRVHLEMSYKPDGWLEGTGDALGFMSRRVEGSLERFRDFIEDRGRETGGWRGRISNPDVAGGETEGLAARPVDEVAAELTHTPGALQPGSLSREAHQRERAAQEDRPAGRKDEYPES